MQRGLSLPLQRRPDIDIMFGRLFCRVLMGKGAGERIKGERIKGKRIKGERIKGERIKGKRVNS